MDEEPRTLPVIILDETAHRRIGYLPPPLQPYVLRHRLVSADQPPARILKERAVSNSTPQSFDNLDSLMVVLGGATTVILVAFSAWRSPSHLMQAVRTLRRNGYELHLVLADSLMTTELVEEHLPDLVNDLVSVVQVFEGAAMDDRLSGCLESMAVALSGSCREHLHGQLAWHGSQRHRDVDTCLDEASSNTAIRPPPAFFTARLEDGMRPLLKEALHRRGFNGHPTEVASRPVGVRVGIFFLHQEIECDECI